MNEMAQLVWMLHNDPEMTDAEFIVRAARRYRWGSARFNPSDVARASRAIERDQQYRTEVSIDAYRHARHVGVGVGHLGQALGRISRSEP